MHASVAVVLVVVAARRVPCLWRLVAGGVRARQRRAECRGSSAFSSRRRWVGAGKMVGWLPGWPGRGNDDDAKGARLRNGMDACFRGQPEERSSV